MDRETGQLVAAIVALVEARTRLDLTHDETAMKRVREAAEKARSEWLVLHASPLVLNLPFLTATARGPYHLDLRLSHAEAERVFAGFPIAEQLAEARAARDREDEEGAGRDADDEEKEADRASYNRQTLVITGIVLLIALGAAISFGTWLVTSGEHHGTDRHGEHVH
ncbi:MAG TPA: Hsp70 family protein [Polyangiaceae bacterium]